MVLMAIQGPIPVHFGQVFPHGAYATGGVDKVRDFDRSSRENFVQAVDKDSGLPVWSIDVIDNDPEARKANKTVTVKIAAKVQPIMPEAPAGWPFTPVEFDGLTVTPYVNGQGRLAYSFKASSVRAPSSAGAAGGASTSASAAGSSGSSAGRARSKEAA
jgi:hypothetical protein